MGRVVAVITTLDNLPLLKEQVDILRDEPVDQIVVVSNGSQDGTDEWLDKQADVTAVYRGNYGAGPGRNAGLDAAGEFDYVLMLDGGIRPLRGGVAHMLDYLERNQEAGVIGVEIPDFETDYAKAWRRWPGPIGDDSTYQNTRLSHTAYCLARREAFDGFRFCTVGPFGEPGWGADDDEMCYQWNEAGINVHVVTCKCRHGQPCNGVHPYRRGSGSFRRLFKETGVWPNQFGSVYERRLVWLQQNWPQYQPGAVWGEPWLTIVVEAVSVGHTARIVKAAHDRLRERRFDPPYDYGWNPYSIVVWADEANRDLMGWADAFGLRQHHGDTVVVNGQVVKRDEKKEDHWTGDFRVWTGPDWRAAIRDNVYFYALVRDMSELTQLLNRYDGIHPRQAKNEPPGEKKEIKHGNV